MKPSCMPLCRRSLLGGALSLAACGATSQASDAGEATDSADAGPCGGRSGPTEAWVEVPLTDVPALREAGGSASVERPEALLNVWVLHLPGGCFTAVWRICTHGACLVEPSAGELTCPCHGSRFGLDGAVLEGPATRALRTFAVVRVDDSLFIRRAV